MKELSLFSGIGGGIYGSLILGWQTVAYVEKDPYCQQVLAQRIKDGWFDKGEIYGDIADFNKHHAHKYTGQIDILTGGFPCQPFSVAGKRKGTSDERYLFDEIIKTIKIVQPQQMLFENVPGILNDPAIIEIYQSLDKIGYTTKAPLLLGSDDCGNIHRRKRVWIFADTTGERQHGWSSQKRNHERPVSQSSQQEGSAFRCEAEGCSVREFYATNTTGSRCQCGQCNRQKRQILSNSTREMAKNQPERSRGKFGSSKNIGIHSANGFCKRSQRGCEKQISWQHKLSRCESIRGIEDIIDRPDIPTPLFCGMDDELSSWRQQLKAIGNGQDPIVMATAYHLLSNN